jgi:hypothetical protein
MLQNVSDHTKAHVQTFRAKEKNTDEKQGWGIDNIFCRQEK